jgi:hypothetical protein
VRLHAALDDAALVPDDAVAVLMVGSRARGWQHERSDLDVVMVSASRWDGPVTERQRVSLADASIGVAVTSVDGVACEVKYWTEAQVRETLAKVAWSVWDADEPGDPLSANELLLVQRLPHAEVLAGHDWWRVVASEVRESAADTRAALASLANADDMLDDVSGLLGSGQVDAAVMALQRAFVHVTDALTASLGQPGTDTKWRRRRLRAAATDVLDEEEFWRVVTMQDFDAERPLEWVEHTAFRCSQIMLEVRLGR